MMNPSDDMRDSGLAVAAEAPDRSSGQQVTTPTAMMRIKEQMVNQCFELATHLSAGKNKRSCSTSAAERDLPEYISELEKLKTLHFNSTLVLHRMQMWHTIAEKLKEKDSEADAMKAVAERCMTLCSHIKQLQQESRSLQSEITEIQKERLEMKRLAHENMKKMEELMSKREHPETEKYKAALEKGQANLEKYKQMTVMTQNVLRGIFLACKVNWLDDPKLREIGMALEQLPIND